MVSASQETRPFAWLWLNKDFLSRLVTATELFTTMSMRIFIQNSHPALPISSVSNNESMTSLSKVWLRTQTSRPRLPTYRGKGSLSCHRASTHVSHRVPNTYEVKSDIISGPNLRHIPPINVSFGNTLPGST